MLRRYFASHFLRRRSTLAALLLLPGVVLCHVAAAQTRGETLSAIALLPPAPEDAPELLAPPQTSPSQPRLQNEPIYTNEPLSVLAARRGLSLPLPDANVTVYKSERRLDIRSGGDIIKSYRVALGANPAGDKTRQGDNRTPEGEFYICTRNSATSAFHIFLGLSYPALPDAQRGLKAKQIDQREYDSIRNRLASRQAPLWETKLGGWIGIHGGSDAPFAQKKMRERGRQDWTAGCIAVTDAEIEELHAASQMRTPVLVLP